MAKRKKSSLANVIMSLPWIFRLLIAIFADCVYGFCRLVDGVIQRNWLKAIVGFLWLFYGLGIGWVIDIIMVALGMRPLLF